MKLTISSNHRYINIDNRGHFILADTCWSGFTHPDMNQWKTYLDYRQKQGFNAVMINVLQQCHSFEPKVWRHPFKRDASGRYEYMNICHEYFDRACTLLDEMAKRNMTAFLVLVWGNYAPDTMQQISMGKAYGKETLNAETKPYLHPMTIEEMSNYVKYAVNRFKGYNPVFVVSGDVNLNEGREVVFESSMGNTVYGDSSERLQIFYKTAMEITKKEAPDCLATYHINPKMTLPKALVCESYPDVYMYQPGHSISPSKQKFSRILAREINSYKYKKPIINSETCYEGNVAFDMPIVRFNERHVRHAFWQGVLSGACSAFIYGAAGIWLWKDETEKCSFRGPVGKVNNWDIDLKLKGADEVAFGKCLIEKYFLYDIEPMDMILDNPGDEFVFSGSDDRSIIAMYQTYSYPVLIDMDMSAYELTAYDLESHAKYIPDVEFKNGKTYIKQAPYNYDVLIIGRRIND